MNNLKTTSGVMVLLLIGACGANDSVAADTADSMKKTAASVAAMSSDSVLKNVPAGQYGLDKTHAYINFSFLHMGFSRPIVGFKAFDVDLDLASDISKSSLDVTIDVNSIDSRVARFDKHLVSDDMFDTANFPNATFKSTSFMMTSFDTVDITGDLTIKDVTRPVTLNAKINKAGNNPRRNIPMIGVSATAEFKRSDFGVSYGVPNVGDDVTIRIEVEMPKAD
ncbi:MAG: YceI family protein [Gammaproteobacteria bacterium]